MDGTPAGKQRSYGTSHVSPYNYDQHVPVLLMGFGIQPGEYFQPITPADIAPTLAALCGITLAPRDGHILSEALTKPAKSSTLIHP
jgi:predicted AlkP superfamily pyrophosphatase or phosphodiesterase